MMPFLQVVRMPLHECMEDPSQKIVHRRNHDTESTGESVQKSF